MREKPLRPLGRSWKTTTVEEAREAFGAAQDITEPLKTTVLGVLKHAPSERECPDWPVFWVSVKYERTSPRPPAAAIAAATSRDAAVEYVRRATAEGLLASFGPMAVWVIDEQSAIVSGHIGPLGWAAAQGEGTCYHVGYVVKTDIYVYTEGT